MSFVSVSPVPVHSRDMIRHMHLPGVTHGSGSVTESSRVAFIIDSMTYMGFDYIQLR